MANRFSSISTSSFKPLSLDEIMAVPLAKQAQHDEATLALDEFSKMEANSLDKDKEYVQGQIGAFQSESDKIANQLLESGVDRNLKNKIVSLRNRKNKEFSLQGKTGQASAAYNQYMANKAAIDARKDLTADQKEAGLAKAKNDYLGVAQGGTYKDYVGTSHIDIMKKGREIASQMTPEEKAQILGMTWDEENGFYVDGDYVTKTLTPEHISKVVYQGLKNDRLVSDYANELQSLGIEEDADRMIRDAAVNAGNVYQVSVNKEDATYREGGRKSREFDDTKGIKNPSDWSTKNFASIQEKTYNYHAISELPSTAYDDNGMIKDDWGEDKEAMKARHKRELDSARTKDIQTGGSSSTLVKQRHAKEMTQPNIKEEQTKRIGKFRDDFKEATEGLNDKQVYDIYSKLQKKSSAYISEIGFPENPESTFNYIKERILGEGENYGDIMSGSRQFHIPGTDRAITASEIADMYDVTEVEMADLMKKGSIGGISVYDPVLPMGFALQFSPDGEKMETIIVSNDNKLGKLNRAAKLNKNMLEGKPFEVEKVRTPQGTVYTHYVLKLNVKRDQAGRVISQSYDPYIMYAEKELSRKDLESMSIEDLENEGIEVDGLTETANVELQQAQRHYDTIINKKTLK